MHTKFDPGFGAVSAKLLACREVLVQMLGGPRFQLLPLLKQKLPCLAPAAPPALGVGHLVCRRHRAGVGGGQHGALRGLGLRAHICWTHHLQVGWRLVIGSDCSCQIADAHGGIP